MDSGQNPVTAETIGSTSSRLRAAVTELRRTQTRTETVALLAAWSRSWFDPASEDRKMAENIGGPFPYAMVQDNLDALLLSINEDTIQELIDTEGVQGVAGYPLIGHVIASNTPLLAWSSIIRALIMQSASLVKLSSYDDGLWIDLFRTSLARISLELCACLEVLSWPGSQDTLNTALCDSVDLVIVYGSDTAIVAFERLTAVKIPIIGYGHRVSIGIVDDFAYEKDITGFARDIVIYDQAGCLSPQMIFFSGTADNAQEFSLNLAKQLASICESIGSFGRDAGALHALRTHRLMARMAGCRVIEDSESRWTVVNAGTASIYPPGGYGVVHVRPIEKLADILQWTELYLGKLQGCAIATMKPLNHKAYSGTFLMEMGFSRICRPGELQTPPISWRQDNRSVLSSLGPSRFS